MKKKPRKTTVNSKKYLQPLKSPRARKADPGIVFSLRLSARELEELRDSALAQGLVVSDLIRRRLFQPSLINSIEGSRLGTTATAPVVKISAEFAATT